MVDRMNYEHSFDAINWCLFTIGSNYASNNRSNTVRTLIFVTFIVHGLVSAFVPLVNGAIITLDEWSVFIVINYSVINGILLRAKLTRLLEIKNQLTLQCDSLSKSEFRCYGFKLASVYFAAILINLSINVLQLQDMDDLRDYYQVHFYVWQEAAKNSQWYYDVYLYLRFLVFIPFHRSHWSSLSVIVYMYFINIINKIELKFLTSTLSKVEESVIAENTISCRHVLRMRCKIADIRHQFEACVNVFPFLWFSALFISSSGHLQLIKNYGDHGTHSHVTTNWLIMELLSYAINACFAFRLLIKIRAENNDINHQCVLLSQSIIRNVHNVEFKQSLLNDLEKGQSIEATGWSLFVLDKSLILSFVGSLITFSILFTQISENKL